MNWRLVRCHEQDSSNYRNSSRTSVTHRTKEMGPPVPDGTAPDNPQSRYHSREARPILRPTLFDLSKAPSQNSLCVSRSTGCAASGLLCFVAAHFHCRSMAVAAKAGGGIWYERYQT